MSAALLLRQATGLDLSEAAVAHAVRRRLRVLDMDDPGAYEALLAGPELARLIEEVVVPESWMFRDAEAFVQMVAFVQERLAAAPQRIVRILSVPCAGGEEPYSMAIALFEAGVPASSWRIDGVDVSLAVLERARAGRFTRNAFRGAEQAFQARWFRCENGIYHIDSALRTQVQFRQESLLEMTPDRGRYDVIFCRNLLIYFDEATVARAIERLDGLLQDDGMLFAGYAEVPAYTRHGFVTLRAPGAFALRKAARQSAAEYQPNAQRTAQPTAQPPVQTMAQPKHAPLRRPAVFPTAPAHSALSGKVAARPLQEQPGQKQAAAPDAAAMLAQARTLADGGKLAQAAALCRSVLAGAPDHAAAHYLLGVVSEPFDSQVAATHYRRCIYLQPDHYEALCHLALLCEHGGDMAQAATLRQRAARVYSRRAGQAS